MEYILQPYEGNILITVSIRWLKGVAVQTATVLQQQDFLMEQFTLHKTPILPVIHRLSKTLHL